jgi:hypothetical protein
MKINNNNPIEEQLCNANLECFKLKFIFGRKQTKILSIYNFNVK